MRADVAVLLSAIVVACSGSGTVTVSGRVTHPTTTTPPCRDLTASDGFSAPVTFYDAAGEVIGSADLGSELVVELDPSENECVAYATYEVELPNEDIYQAQFPGKLIKLSKSYDQLASDGFRWDV